MAKSVDAEWVEKKLRSANDTMESVQTLSLWALKHKNQCEQIVAIWLKVLKSEEPGQMIVMFYLCNEVIQTCKKKNAHVYKESFKNVLKEAVSAVKDRRAILGLEKILNVWSDRKVFEESFIVELNSILSEASTESSKSENTSAKEADSMSCSLISKREKAGMQVSDFNLITLCSLLKTDAKQWLKIKEEMSICSRFIEDINDLTPGTGSLNQASYLERNEEKINRLCMVYIDLNSYLDKKHQLCELLDVAEQFYEGLLRDAKLVSSAYKNYGNRVVNLSKKLADRRNLLMLSEQSKQEEEDDDDEEECIVTANAPQSERIGKSANHLNSTFKNKFIKSGNLLASRRQRSSSGEEYNFYKDIGRFQESVEDEEDKLFTHLFLEDPSEDDHQRLNETGNRRQSLDARLESMRFSGLQSSEETTSHKQVTETAASEPQPKSDFYKDFASPPVLGATIVPSYQLVPSQEFIGSGTSRGTTFNPSFQVLGQQHLPALQHQQQQIAFSQQLIVPQASAGMQPQIVQPIKNQEEEYYDGRATPVQDEPPSPGPSTEHLYPSKSPNVSLYMSKEVREKDESCNFYKLSDSSKRHRDEEDRNASKRRSSHDLSCSDDERRHKEKSSKRRGHEYRNEERKSNREKRQSGRSSREYLRSLKSRHRSRDSSRESGKRVKKSFYLESSKKCARSKTKELSPVLHGGRSSSSLSSMSLSENSNKPLAADYLRKMPGSEIVMEGIYQAVERPDGYSEIYRLPSNVDPSQYTYEEVVYLFTEDDGAPQLKQLVQNSSLSSEASVGVMRAPATQYLANSGNMVIASSMLTSFPAASSFKSSGTSAMCFPTASQVLNPLPPQAQTLMPINVIPGVAQTQIINPPGPAQISVQVPPPPLPQQTVYPFVQQPPPPLPAAVLPQVITPVMAPSPLMTNHLKISVAQASSILGVPIVNQIPSSASSFASFQGMSKVLPSPSQFCQGIGATALLQRRLDENSLDNLTRVRSAQIQIGKSQVSSSRRASILTTVPLTDDVSDKIELANCTVSENPNRTLDAFPGETGEKGKLSEVKTEINKRHANGDGDIQETAEQGHSSKGHCLSKSFSDLSTVSSQPSEIEAKQENSDHTGTTSEDCTSKSESHSATKPSRDDDFLSDSSDLEDFQDAVTFTSPLSVSGTLAASYPSSRGRETKNQFNLSRRGTNARSQTSLGSMNRGRGLLPNSFIPSRLPLFSVNQFQQFRNNFSPGSINFSPMAGVRLATVPPFNIGLPLSMPANRQNVKGNQRF